MATLRRPFLVGIPVLVLLIQLVGTTFAAEHQNDPLDPFAYCLLIAGPVVLLLRDKFPLPVFFTVVAITATYLALGHPRGPIFLSLAVALFTVALSGHRIVGYASIGVGVVTYFGYRFVVDEPLLLGPASGATVWAAVVVAVADAIRIRRIARAEAQRTFDEEQKRRASDERLAIARELHDVLAHSISLINVQSSVALHFLDTNPEQARAALGTIKTATKDTLREMRSVLGVLRRVDEELPRAPTSGLSDLPALVEQLGVAGLTVRVTTTGVDSVPTSVDQAAYRITQEALTNIMRHSAAKTATVALSRSASELIVHIDDPGPATAHPNEDSGGNGIMGMRERAAALGGELTAVTKPDGGFRVTARLPLAPPTE